LFECCPWKMVVIGTGPTGQAQTSQRAWPLLGSWSKACCSCVCLLRWGPWPSPGWTDSWTKTGARPASCQLHCQHAWTRFKQDGLWWSKEDSLAQSKEELNGDSLKYLASNQHV
jgi:hypothetical protein